MKIPNLQLIPGLFVLDPDFSLRLWVYQEREASGFGHNDAIVNGQVIIGKPLQDGHWRTVRINSLLLTKTHMKQFSSQVFSVYSASFLQYLIEELQTFQS